MLTLGQIGLGLALVATVLAAVFFLFGHLQKGADKSLSRIGYYLTFAGVAGLTISVVIITVSFFTKDYSISYVATQHTTDASSLAWLYKLAGLWAGREGSLLFWTWLMSLFAGYVAWKSVATEDELGNMALMIINTIIALFTVAMIFSTPNNPFVATPAQYLSNGMLVGAAAQWGMSPLLQHWAMILHPPALFIGYAGLTVPFAFAMSTLIINDSSDRWIRWSDRITIFSWLFLGIGIGLGAIWAYVVLGWGGYWGWDPVENASILPWFIGVAMIHSFTMYRRKGGFKRWAIMSTAITFAMVVLGTFITRSGIVQSVHAFAPDNLSLWLFLFIIVGSIAAGVIGLAVRWKEFAGADDFDSLTGREAAYYFNNVLMLVASVVIAYMTVASALPKWLPFGGQSLGAVAYDLIARPVGILYLVLMALCPALSWALTDGATFWKRIKWPLVATLVMFGLLVTEWLVNLRPVYADMVALGGDTAKGFTSFGPQIVYDILTLLGFFFASFVICNTVALFVRGVKARMGGRGEGVGTALGAVFFKARSQSGGYLAHIAIGIIVIGLIGSSMYVRDVNSTIQAKVGETVQVSNYAFTYTGSKEVTKSNGDVDKKVYLTVKKDGKQIGVVTPSLTMFAAQGQSRLNAVVLTGPLRDIFVVFQGDVNGTLSLDVKINPLIWFVWIGFILLLIGAGLAAWPKRKAITA
ncbi:MAG: cytochrome c biogenesis protein CcsA [Coriobacteriia bacterium]|nr:cytochrome c biogenesis protein CcsA [Coriobacteriia bacterium]